MCAAWESARADILKEWSDATDPKKYQPKVKRTFKKITEHLRAHPPVGVMSKELDRAVEAVEAPWGGRIERQLRSLLKEEGLAPVEISRRILEKVRDLGLQPFRAPEPLPPIEKDDILPVCWMIVGA